MEKYNWERLSSLQVGKYAEYFMKMEFTLFGWDIYSPEIDAMVREEIKRPMGHK